MRHYPGINLVTLKRRIWTYSRSHEVDVAYIMAGVNDITYKDPYTGECYVAHESPNELRDNLMDKYMDLLRYCYTQCDINHVIICTMTGLSLARYNRSLGLQYGQWRINWGVRLLNEDITACNGAHGYHTPCLHQAIHLVQQRPFRYRDMYNRLRDGLHPTHWTLTKWAVSLTRCMRLNNHI